MKNKEKFANEIVEVAIKNDMVSVDKQTGEILSCFGADCEKCLFFQPCSRPFTCRGMFSSWANAEYKESKYKEPKIFTEREKAFIKLFPEIQYIAKDENDKIFGYLQKPIKDEEEGWWTCDDDTDILFEISSSFGDLLKFESIQWEDEEPTSREEILGK